MSDLFAFDLQSRKVSIAKGFDTNIAFPELVIFNEKSVYYPQQSNNQSNRIIFNLIAKCIGADKVYTNNCYFVFDIPKSKNSTDLFELLIEISNTI